MAEKSASSRRPARRATEETAGRASLVGDVIPPTGEGQKEVVVVNLAEMRAIKSRQRRVIVDQNNEKHHLAGLTIDAYFALMEVEQEYKYLKGQEDKGELRRERQVALLTTMRESILAVLPDFPVGGLLLDELFVVTQAIQQSIQPGGIKEIEGDAEPGK